MNDRDEKDDLIEAAARGMVCHDAPATMRARVENQLRAGEEEAATKLPRWLPGFLAAAAVVGVVALRFETSPGPRPLPPSAQAGPTAGPTGEAAIAPAPATAAAVARAERAAAPLPPPRSASRRATAGPFGASLEGDGPVPLEPELLEVAPQETEPLAMAALDVPRLVLDPLDAIPELDSDTEER